MDSLTNHDVTVTVVFRAVKSADQHSADLESTAVLLMLLQGSNQFDVQEARSNYIKVRPTL